MGCIRSSNLARGDDCVSVQTGCISVYIHSKLWTWTWNQHWRARKGQNQVLCLKHYCPRNQHAQQNDWCKDKDMAGWFRVCARNIVLKHSSSEVKIPIIIDQYECDQDKCKNQTSAVAPSQITYEKIKGTYTVQPVYLACSDSLPCADVTLADTELNPIQEHYHMYDSFRWQTFGDLNCPIEPPFDCLQDGKQLSKRIQNDQDSC